MPGNMNKEDHLREAARLGIEGAEQMDWPTLQREVKRALQREEFGMLDKKTEIAESYKEAVEETQEHQSLTEVRQNFDYLDDLKKAPKPKKKPKAQRTIKEFTQPNDIEISPLLVEDAGRAIHYHETIGDDMVVEEVYYDLGDGNKFKGGRDTATGTYTLLGKTGRKVEAELAAPKRNAGIVWRKGDPFPISYIKDRMGVHKSLFRNLIRQVEIAEGVSLWPKYRRQLIGEPNVFYVFNKMHVDYDLAISILKEIEETVGKGKQVDDYNTAKQIADSLQELVKQIKGE